MDGWEHKPLSEICDFQRGLTYAKADEADAPGHTVLRANNIDLTSHELDFKELRFISGSVAVPASKIVRPGSLLVCTASGSKTHLGKVAYIDADYGYAFGGFMGQLTPSKGVDGRYLFYALISPGYKDFIAALSDGVNINNLKFDDLGRYSVPLPLLPEQRRIVAILDEAFEAIATAKANTEKNLRNARDVFEGYLGDVFSTRNDGWTDRQLNSLCQRITVGHVGSMAKLYKPTGIPFLRSQNVRPFSISMENLVFIDEHFHATLGKSSLQAGDVAIVRTGYPGTAAVIPQSLGIANCSDLVIVRPGPEIDAHFLCAFFNSTFGKTMVSGKVVGAAQKHFNVGAAKEVVLHLPPLAEQRAIVVAADDLREATNQLEGICLRKLAALDELKKSLLHQAFTGALTAKSTDEQLEPVA